MVTALDLLKKLEAFDVENVVERIFESTEEELVEAQRQQMLHGENRDGEKIGVYRSPTYADAKEKHNPLAGGYVDLRVTEAFYRGIYASVVGEELLISSFDEKADDLEDKYGEEIFGLNENYRVDFVVQELQPLFQQEVERALGLTFQ